MFMKSLRFKIILWHMVISSLALFLLGIILYQKLSYRLNSNLDDVLKSKVAGIVDSFDTYWDTEKIQSLKDNKKKNPGSKIPSLSLQKIAQQWFLEKANDPILLNLAVQIFDENGEEIAATENAPNIISLNKEIFNSMLQGKGIFNNLIIELSSGKPNIFRTLTMPVIENEKLSYFIQLASPLTSFNSELKNLKLVLFLLLPFTVVITGIISTFLTKLTLKPIDRMINTIDQITAENLKMRIAVPDTKDEIRRLADTFNKMLEQIQNAFTSQRKLTEDLAHELKTPLSVIKGELEVTMRKIRSTKEYESILGSNLEEINRIIKIVENLLILSRYECKVITPEINPLNLGSLVKSTLDDVKILADHKHIHTDLLIDGEIILSGDQGMLKRLIIALLDNAFKFTPISGKVSINVIKNSDFAKLEISDNGIGISKEDMPHIFDRFYRINKNHNYNGFGLGLSIVKSIVDAHKGKIEVKSTLDEGSIFTVFLPLSYQP
ncbi:MAG: hypothetical protein A2161_16450 [Candidatus Schekmanbacteria bacterium RBG_13_48_7]|uniref:histidine kinase n=1 Tax=Candidatus Schekmanbacteria bacterium RBG_13_48_7 TaxID=1817878 RepID=A0A1F7RWF4_9BACT|nr:MAG: hypothetical protein A2161_16450 [Candidatus Schekmanbacteria bacterium RBG_13_48_7]